MAQAKRVMLIFPPVTRPKDFASQKVRVSIFFPLGIAYLAAVIQKTGKYDLQVLDALSEGNVNEGIPLADGKIRYGLTDQELMDRIRAFNPDVVGVACLFSAMQWDMGNACSLAKEVNPDIVTVIGGAHVGLTPQELIRQHKEVDFLIEGEAEVTLLKLLESLNAGFLAPELNGIAFWRDGKVQHIPKTDYIMDLDTIPFPARGLFNMRKYFESPNSHGFYKKTPYTQMITSRGCPNKCTFCALGAHWGSKQRMRSANNVLDEIEFLIQEYGIREIHFEDDNITSNKKRAMAIFEGMIERQFNIIWHVPSGMAANTLDEELLTKMKESGCYSLTLAIESGNQHVVSRLMKKPVNLKRIPGLVKQIRNLNMDVRGFFILGYPDETKENMRETINFAREIELDWSYFSIFSPLPGTKSYNTCLEKGYIKKEDFDPLRSFHQSIVRTPEFTPEYLAEIREEAIVDVCFRNNPNLLKYDINKAIENFSSVVERYPHFDFANFYLGEAYLKKGEKSKAIQAYQDTLKSNPEYAAAKKRIEELQAANQN